MKRSGKTLTFSAILVVFLIGFLELGSYFTLKILGSSFTGKIDYVESFSRSGLYDGIDLDVLHKEMRETWYGIDYDYYRSFRPNRNYNGKYHTTDWEGFRTTVQFTKPDTSLPTKTIAMFGGSTLWSTGVPFDKETLASKFAKDINAFDPTTNYIVKNYGVPTFHSTQELIVLLERLENESFDVAVFYDGINEVGNGLAEFIAGETDRQFIRPSINLVRHAAADLLENEGGVFSKLFPLRRLVQEVNTLQLLRAVRRNLASRSTVGDREQEISLNESHEKQIDRLRDQYLKNMRIIKALGREYGFQPYFILQPNLFTKEMRSEYEINFAMTTGRLHELFSQAYYDKMRPIIAQDPTAFDLSEVITSDETVYYDTAHPVTLGNNLISAALTNRLGPLMVRD